MAETLRSDLRRSDRWMFGIFGYVGRFCEVSLMVVSDRQKSPAIAAGDVGSKPPSFGRNLSSRSRQFGPFDFNHLGV